MMAGITGCCCFSLSQGSFIIGTYALLVYCVAFAVELWWIVESMLILPAPAYTLAALYLFNFIMAAVLLFGLLIRQRRYLMSWTLMSVLSFFPEAGMVLFMSLYYWPAHKYEYALMELVCWAIRAICNIFGAVCVCSLYLTWRDEELILTRLHDLNLSNVDVESGDTELRGGGGGNISVIGVGRRHPPLLDHTHFGTLKSNLAYHNHGYLDLSSSTFHKPFSHSRNFSASQTQLNTSTVTSPALSAPASHLRASLLRMKSEFNPSHMFQGSHTHTHNKYQQHLAEMGIGGGDGYPLDLEPLPPPRPRPCNKSRSVWSVNQNEDFWSRPLPSRPASMSYLSYNQNHNHTHYKNDLLLDMSLPQGRTPRTRSQSHTHLHQLHKGLRPLREEEPVVGVGRWGRAQSMDALNYNNLFHQRYHHQQGRKSFYEEQEVNARPWSERSSLDDGRSYQDIPL